MKKRRQLWVHRQLRRAADGQPTEAVYFRDGDLWHDFADDFNQLVARIGPSQDKKSRRPSREN